MNDPETVLRLMVALMGLLYLALSHMATRDDPDTRIVPLTIVAGLLVGAWAFWPPFFSAGQFSLPFTVRRAGLFVCAAGVVLRYLRVRRTDGPPALRSADRFSTAVFTGGLVVTTANWLIAAALAIVAVRSIFRRAAASADEDSGRPRPPQDGE